MTNPITTDGSFTSVLPCDSVSTTLPSSQGPTMPLSAATAFTSVSQPNARRCRRNSVFR